MITALQLPIEIIIAIVLVTIWDGVWKIIALWKSARNHQIAWFICLAIFNTVGILPIVYILFFQRKPKAAAKVKARTRR